VVVATGPGVAGFCGVVYPLFDAVEEEEDEVEEPESEDMDIGLRRLRSSPLVLAALDPGLLPVGVDVADVDGVMGIMYC
jgi:hypothetical protein